jgi:hypothetical protein
MSLMVMISTAPVSETRPFGKPAHSPTATTTAPHSAATA